MALQSLDIDNQSASDLHAAVGAQHAGGGQAHRRLALHRLQGLPVGLHGVERPARRGGRRSGLLHQPAGPLRPVLVPDALQRAGDRRPPAVAHPQGRLPPLRGPGLPAGLPGARRHRPVLERHRRLPGGALHRLRLLHRRLPLQHPAPPPGRTPRSTSARSAPTGSRSGWSRPASRPARPRRSPSAPRRTCSSWPSTGWRTCASGASRRRPSTTRRAWAAPTCSSCCRTATGPRPTACRRTRGSARWWTSGGAAWPAPPGVFTMFAVLVAGILHYMRHGPLEVPDREDEEVKP